MLTGRIYLAYSRYASGRLFSEQTGKVTLFLYGG